MAAAETAASASFKPKVTNGEINRSSKSTISRGWKNAMTLGKNKKRLYIALYPSGTTNNEERKYHWAFIIGPKNESKQEVSGIRCHVKNTAGRGWMYEQTNIQDVNFNVNLLARVLIAKIKDEEQLLKILRDTPVRQDDPSFRCRTWLADALSRVARSKPCVVGTAELDWGKIEQTARRFVEEKIAAGRYRDTYDAEKRRPTWNMLEEQEM